MLASLLIIIGITRYSVITTTTVHLHTGIITYTDTGSTGFCFCHSATLGIGSMSVRPSVCHMLVLTQN